jgi:hypothetical protein
VSALLTRSASEESRATFILSRALIVAGVKRAKSDLPPAQLVTLLETLSKAKSADVTSVFVAQLKHMDEEVRSTGVRLLTDRSDKTAGEATAFRAA